MESSAALRNKVQNYIQSADTKLLRMVKELVESYQAEDAKTTLTEAQKKELDERLTRYEQGKTRFLTWDEVEENLNQAK